MDAATREFVRRRADNRCEYCLLRREHSGLTHHIEHVIAKQHGGRDDADNLALACHRCNLRKGPNLTGMDPVSGEVVPLFHPRRDQWAEHFLFRRFRIEGITSVGRATVRVLALNDARRLELRAELLAAGDL
ncbi:MAG: HNH endonuclease [Terriglobia bacterium]